MGQKGTRRGVWNILILKAEGNQIVKQYNCLLSDCWNKNGVYVSPPTRLMNIKSPAGYKAIAIEQTPYNAFDFTATITFELISI